jgi:hypothetical protein
MSLPEEWNGLDEIARLRLEAFAALLERELRVAEGYPDVQARLRAQREQVRSALERLAARRAGTEEEQTMNHRSQKSY